MCFFCSFFSLHHVSSAERTKYLALVDMSNTHTVLSVRNTYLRYGTSCVGFLSKARLDSKVGRGSCQVQGSSQLDCEVSQLDIG